MFLLILSSSFFLSGLPSYYLYAFLNSNTLSFIVLSFSFLLLAPFKCSYIIASPILCFSFYSFPPFIVSFSLTLILSFSCRFLLSLFPVFLSISFFSPVYFLLSFLRSLLLLCFSFLLFLNYLIVISLILLVINLFIDLFFNCFFISVYILLLSSAFLILSSSHFPVCSITCYLLFHLFLSTSHSCFIILFFLFPFSMSFLSLHLNLSFSALFCLHTDSLLRFSYYYPAFSSFWTFFTLLFSSSYLGSADSLLFVISHTYLLPYIFSPFHLTLPSSLFSSLLRNFLTFVTLVS